MTGVRFQFATRGGGQSTALECLNPPTCTQWGLRAAWKTNLRNFFQDIKNSGINNITPIPSLYGWLNDDMEWRQVSGCGSTNIWLRFWRTVPFGVSAGSSGLLPGEPAGPEPAGPWKAGYNDSYNCSPYNPRFIGWQNIYSVINEILLAAKEKTLIAYEWDVENEINLQWFTVYARLILDNKTQHGSAYDREVLLRLREKMQLQGFDPKRVFYSLPLAGSRLENFDCGSLYGDSARIYMLSAMVAAIGGGVFGHPVNWSVQNGLGCGGTWNAPPYPMVSTGVYYSAANVVDIHASPCVYKVNPDQTVTCDLAKANKVEGEARLSFSGIKAFLASFGPGGWRYPHPDSALASALVMLGETHSNTTKVPPGNKSCEDAPLSAPANTITGFNSSTLSGHSGAVVFRPWGNQRWGYSPFRCDPYPQVVSPPYTPTP